jgi:hypothetical protein
VSDAGGSLSTLGAEADAIAAVVQAQPGVARLSGGPAGVIGTYLPGHRVPGVRLTDSEVEVHVVARWVSSLPQLADQVRAALAPLAHRRAVSVYIDDIEAAALATDHESI